MPRTALVLLRDLSPAPLSGGGAVVINNSRNTTLRSQARMEESAAATGTYLKNGVGRL